MGFKRVLVYFVVILILVELCHCYIEEIKDSDMEELQQFLNKLPTDLEVVPGELSPVMEPYVEI